MQEFFNDYVQSLETYIMFRIKETVAKITPELKAKNRAPIMLSMGAPTAAPPKALTETLKTVLDEKVYICIHRLRVKSIIVMRLQNV